MVGVVVESVLVVLGSGVFGAFALHFYVRRLRAGTESNAVDEASSPGQSVIIAILLVGTALALLPTGYFGFVDRTVREFISGPRAVIEALNAFFIILGSVSALSIASFGAELMDNGFPNRTAAWIYHPIDVIRGYVGTILQVGIVLFVLAGAAMVLPDRVALPAGLALAVVIHLVLFSIFVRIDTPTRPPTAAERERLSAICSDLGLNVSGTRIISVRYGTSISAELGGLPGRRHLVATDDFLETDEKHMRGMLALAAGRASTFHREVEILLFWAGVYGSVAVVFDFVPVPTANPLYMFPVIIAIMVLGFWFGQYLIYVADSLAARRAGAEVVADAIERRYQDEGVPLEWSRNLRFGNMEPSPKQRIERLRRRGVD